jgi:hypothetical protein
MFFPVLSNYDREKKKRDIITNDAQTVKAFVFKNLILDKKK